MTFQLSSCVSGASFIPKKLGAAIQTEIKSVCLQGCEGTGGERVSNSQAGFERLFLLACAQLVAPVEVSENLQDDLKYICLFLGVFFFFSPKSSAGALGLGGDMPGVTGPILRLELVTNKKVLGGNVDKKDVV